MGIDAAWIKENGEPIQEVHDPAQCLTRLSQQWSTLSHTVCLRFVDPWGDAIFNQGQVPFLLEELRSDLPQVGVAELRVHLEKVIRLVERAQNRTHTYVRFTGD